jgi:hypothetical protein
MFSTNFLSTTQNLNDIRLATRWYRYLLSTSPRGHTVYEYIRIACTFYVHIYNYFSHQFHFIIFVVMTHPKGLADQG